MTLATMKDSAKNRISNMSTTEKVVTGIVVGAAIGAGGGIVAASAAGIGGSIATGAMAGTIGVGKIAFGATVGGMAGATLGAITSAVKTSR